MITDASPAMKHRNPFSPRRNRFLHPAFYWTLAALPIAGLGAEVAGYFALGGIDAGFAVGCAVLAAALAAAALEAR